MKTNIILMLLTLAMPYTQYAVPAQINVRTVPKSASNAHSFDSITNRTYGHTNITWYIEFDVEQTSKEKAQNNKCKFKAKVGSSLQADLIISDSWKVGWSHCCNGIGAEWLPIAGKLRRHETDHQKCAINFASNTANFSAFYSTANTYEVEEEAKDWTSAKSKLREKMKSKIDTLKNKTIKKEHDIKQRSIDIECSVFVLHHRNCSCYNCSPCLYY